MSLNLNFKGADYNVAAEFGVNTTGLELRQIIANNLNRHYSAIIAPRDIKVILCGHTVKDSEYPYKWLQENDQLKRIPNGHFIKVNALAPTQPAAVAPQSHPAAPVTQQQDPLVPIQLPATDVQLQDPALASPMSIELLIKMPTGKAIKIAVSPDETCEVIKQRIFEKDANFPVEGQKIILKGVEIDYNQKITVYPFQCARATLMVYEPVNSNSAAPARPNDQVTALQAKVGRLEDENKKLKATLSSIMGFLGSIPGLLADLMARIPSLSELFGSSEPPTNSV